MKLLFVSLFMIQFATPAFATERSIDEVKNNIRRLSDHVYEEVNNSNISLEKMTLAEKYLLAAISTLRGEQVNPGDQYDRTSCIKYVLDAGYSPSTAAQTCDSISTMVEFSCTAYVMKAGYNPGTSAGYCAKIKASEFECFKTVMEKGFGPQRSRETCVRN